MKRIDKQYRHYIKLEKKIWFTWCRYSVSFARRSMKLGSVQG
jgi:hypothetical protein